MAIVNSSIGTTGRDHSTFASWIAADGDGDGLGNDDCTGTMYDDSEFDELADVNFSANSVTLTAPESERSDGTEGTGVRNVVTTGPVSVVGIMKISVTMVIEWLEVDGAQLGNTLNPIGINLAAPPSFIRNCIIHGVHSNGVGASCVGIKISHNTYPGAPPLTDSITNTLVYDIDGGGTTNGDDTFGIETAGTRAINATNLTIHDIQAHSSADPANCLKFGEDSDFVLKNICATDAANSDSGGAADYSDSSYTTTTSENNLSSDTTASGTDSIVSEASSGIYVSNSAPYDLHQKANSPTIRQGQDLVVTPAGVEIDLDGYDRDASGRIWDIGAFQWVRVSTHSIGTTARDDSTATLWEADLDDTAVYSTSDDVVGEAYDDSSFNEHITINGGSTIGLESILLTAAVGEMHDGTAGTGVRNISITSQKNFAFGIGPVVQFDGWEWSGEDISASAAMINGGSRTSFAEATFSRLIIRNKVRNSSDPTVMFSFGSKRNNHLVNSVLYSASTPNATGGVKAVNSGSQDAPECTVRNCTLYGTAAAGSGDASNIDLNDTDKTVTNTIAMDASSVSGTPLDFKLGVSNESYNLSSDATAGGTGSLINKASADQFVSTVAGSEDLHLKSGADAIGAGTDLGTTPNHVEVDISGRDRDAEADTWDIGAHQFVAVGGGFVDNTTPILTHILAG